MAAVKSDLLCVSRWSLPPADLLCWSITPDFFPLATNTFQPPTVCLFPQCERLHLICERCRCEGGDAQPSCGGSQGGRCYRPPLRAA